MIDTIVVLGIVILVGLWLTIAIIRARSHGVISVKNCSMDCVHCKESYRYVSKQNSPKDDKGIEQRNTASCCR